MPSLLPRLDGDRVFKWERFLLVVTYIRKVSAAKIPKVPGVPCNVNLALRAMLLFKANTHRRTVRCHFTATQKTISLLTKINNRYHLTMYQIEPGFEHKISKSILITQGLKYFVLGNFNLPFWHEGSDVSRDHKNVVDATSWQLVTVGPIATNPGSQV